MKHLKAGLALSLLSFLDFGSAIAQDRTFSATGTVERKYFAPGPAGVKRITSAEPCDIPALEREFGPTLKLDQWLSGPGKSLFEEALNAPQADIALR